MNSSPIRAVSVAVVRQGRFLLVRRGREPAKGLFAFPGGRIEKGETAEQAARRELLEETGVTAGKLAFVEEISVGDEGRATAGGEIGPVFHLSIYCAAHASGEPQAADDADHAGWYTVKDMRTLPMTETTVEIAEKIVTERGLSA